MSGDYAKRILTHYFKLAIPNLPADSIAEIESAIDDLIAPKEEKTERKKISVYIARIDIAVMANHVSDAEDGINEMLSRKLGCYGDDNAFVWDWGYSPDPKRDGTFLLPTPVEIYPDDYEEGDFATLLPM